jgi:hypothetical protein
MVSPTTESSPVPALPSNGNPISPVESDGNPFASPQREKEPRRSFFGRRDNSNPNGNGRNSPRKASTPGLREEDIEEIDVSPVSPDDTGFVLVDSPNSKARAATLKAVSPSRNTFDDDQFADAPNSYDPDEPLPASKLPNRVPPFAVKRVKNLPPPPVGQVIPDFDDIAPAPRRQGSYDNRLDSGAVDQAGLRRKTSMVKKLKEKMVK